MANETDIKRDYSLTGNEAKIAVETGLADAEWYKSPVPELKCVVACQKKWPCHP